jgi:photosystem II stability/assembly factor-like uncharacterized protein
VPIVLALTMLLLSACHTAPRTPRVSAPKVLGQQSGNPTVVGQPAPAGTGELGAVSCADALHCWAVGIPGPNAPATTAAPVTVIAATVNGGRTWFAQSPPLPAPPELSGISCPTFTSCMAVGSTGAVPGAGIVLTTRNGGITWTTSTVPTGAFVLDSVLCTSLTACTAITSDGTNTWSARTVDFGQTWVQQGNLPVGFSNPRTLSCTAAGTCLVAGYAPTTTGHGQGAIVISADGGQTWAAATVPPNLGVLQSASCAGAGSCLAVGTTSTTVSDVVPATGQQLTSTDGGHTWTVSAPAPPVDDVYGIACPSTLICVIVGTDWVGQPPIGSGGVAQSANGGASYRASKTAYVPLTLTALACPSVTTCVAVGGDTVARITLSAPAPAPAGTPGAPTTGEHRGPLR